MSSPYRHHKSLRVVHLEIRPEVLASVLSAMTITFVTGLSLCATADETLGLAAGTMLMLVTLAVAPLTARSTRRRPRRLLIEGEVLRLAYPDGSTRTMGADDLFVHRVGRGRIALDREAGMVIWLDELTSEARTTVCALLSKRAGYDVMDPAGEAARLVGLTREAA